MAKDKDEVKIPRGRDISSLSDALNKYMKSDISVPGDHVSSISESTHLYPTSILSLDKYLGVGGVLGGRIMNIWGWEGSGKTLTALTVAAGLQRLKIPESAANPEGVPRVAFMDAEGCITGDAQILDASTGTLVSMEEMVRRPGVEVVPCINETTGTAHLGAVTAKIDSGVKPCIRIRTRVHSTELTATHNHPVYVAGHGWKKLEDVNVGDFVARPKKVNAHVTSGGVDSTDAKLVGYLIGDGCLANTSMVRMAIYDEAILADVKSLISDKYPELTLEIVGAGSKSTYAITSGTSKPGSNRLLTLLKDVRLFGNKHCNKVIPQQFVNSGEEVTLSLLAGLFMSDGTVGATRPVISYSTTSKKLAEQVKYLLHRLGVVGSIIESNDRRKSTYLTSYRVMAYGAKNLAPLMNMPLVGRKLQNLRKFGSYVNSADSANSVPAYLLPMIAADLKRRGISSNEFRKELGLSTNSSGLSFNRRAKTIPAHYLQTIKDKFGVDYTKWMPTDVWWDMVVEKSDVGDQQVYDLSVDEHHSFIANDVIVHNTFSPTLAASIGVDCSKLLVIKSTPERIISGEDYFHLAGILIQNGIEMIIIDSVPALVPSARLTAVAAQGQKAAQAQMLSEGLAQLNTFLNAFQRSSVWMINQVRAKPMVMFGSPEDHTGGNALKFYSTYSLEVKKFDSDGDIKKSVPKQHGSGYEDRKIGVKIRATLHKNKTAPIPEKSIEYEVYFENVTDKEGYTYQAGVDIYKDVFQTALLSGIITQNSSWYSYGDIKANGESGFIQELRKADASVLAKIRNEVLSKGSAV